MENIKKHTVTVSDPRISAAKIDILTAKTHTKKLLKRIPVQFQLEGCEIHHLDIHQGFRDLLEMLDRIYERLDRCQHPADPEKLRRVLLNSLNSRS